MCFGWNISPQSAADGSFLCKSCNSLGRYTRYVDGKGIPKEIADSRNEFTPSSQRHLLGPGRQTQYRGANLNGICESPDYCRHLNLFNYPLFLQPMDSPGLIALRFFGAGNIF